MAFDMIDKSVLTRVLNHTFVTGRQPQNTIFFFYIIFFFSGPQNTATTNTSNM